MLGGADATRRSPSLLDDRLVVADQGEAAVEEAQGKVGLAGARRAEDDDGAALVRDRAGVEGLGGNARPAGCTASFAVRRRQADRESGARWGVIAVVHVNLPVMSFDNGPGDRKAEARMSPEPFALGPY